jgi:hypothetical protein
MTSGVRVRFVGTTIFHRLNRIDSNRGCGWSCTTRAAIRAGFAAALVPPVDGEHAAIVNRFPIFAYGG